MTDLADTRPFTVATRARWPILLVLPLAALVAAASLGGLLLPAAYAGETPGWALEAIAQDWFDLLLVCPLLVLGAAGTLRGSAAASAVLAGSVMFVVYSFVIYAFDVHFNALFLLYCATLCTSAWALAGLIGAAMRASASAGPAAPGRWITVFAGWFLLVIALLFAALWLSDILPATLAGVVPEKIAAAGVPTNPVHVIDLSFFLPAQVAVAIALLRRRPLGYALAPAFLAFGVLMLALIAANQLLAMSAGVPGSIPVLAIFGALIVAHLVTLVLVLRNATSRPR